MHDAHFTTFLTRRFLFLESARKNKEKAKDLAEETSSWIKTLVESLQNAPHAQVPALRANVEEFRKSVSYLCQYTPLIIFHHRVLDETVELTTKSQGRDFISAALRKSKDAEEMQDKRDKLKGAYERFMVRGI
jgi:broad specificity polyphosphatase/5'/3'-nucleotidase SurE